MPCAVLAVAPLGMFDVPPKPPGAETCRRRRRSLVWEGGPYISQRSAHAGVHWL
jgi:hypothetical protein